MEGEYTTSNMSLFEGISEHHVIFFIVKCDFFMDSFPSSLTLDSNSHCLSASLSFFFSNIVCPYFVLGMNY